jgi:hypothetical protein
VCVSSHTSDEAIASALLWLGDLGRDQGDTAQVRANCEECLSVFQEYGLQWVTVRLIGTVQLSEGRAMSLPRLSAHSNLTVSLIRLAD